MNETAEGESKARAEEVIAAYWDGYAAGLKGRGSHREPAGWFFIAAMGVSVASWVGVAAIVINFL